MIGLSDDQIKMLTGKAVKEDMDPYYVNVKLKPWFIEIAKKLRLTGYASENHDRMDSIEEVTTLVSESLAEMLRPIIERKLLARQLSRGGETMGLLRKPDLEGKSAKDILQAYLRLTKEEKEER
jgi:hypothetical protein